jgi:FkbM family methyltransferase
MTGTLGTRPPVGRRGSVRKCLGWARSILAPRDRLLPGVGVRLRGHPRFVASVLVFIRRLPGRRLSAAAQHHVSRPLLRRMATQLEVPVSGGFRMRLDTTDPVGRVLAIGGVWEPPVTALFRSALSPGDVCVDVGANIGYFTLLAAALVGPNGRVYALEPAPDTYAALAASIELNRFSNVRALCVAAGEAEGEALLDDHVHSVLSSIRGTSNDGNGEADGLTVPVRSVASVIEPSDLSRLRLVKIDVEGYELEVLRGLEPVLEGGARPTVMVEVHAGRGRRAVPLLLDLVEKYDLKPYELAKDGDLPRMEPWVDHNIGSTGRHIVLTP